MDCWGAWTQEKIPEHCGIFFIYFLFWHLFIEILFQFIQIDLRDDPKTLARLLQMKEKPLTYEQGLKLAREVMFVFLHFWWFGLIVSCLLLICPVFKKQKAWFMNNHHCVSKHWKN